MLDIPNIHLLHTDFAEDNSKDRRKGRTGDRVEYVVSSETLVEIMEESIRIFWRFVRADKDCSSVVVKGHKGTPEQLQNPGDLELLMEIKKILHKVHLLQPFSTLQV